MHFPLPRKFFLFPLVLKSADLFIPSGRQTPIAAELLFTAQDRLVQGEGHFDWRDIDDEVWTISIQCREGRLVLENGGRRLLINGEKTVEHGDDEYPAIYRHFASLVSAGESFIHTDPFRLVADANLTGYRTTVEPFVG